MKDMYSRTQKRKVGYLHQASTDFSDASFRCSACREKMDRYWYTDRQLPRGSGIALDLLASLQTAGSGMSRSENSSLQAQYFKSLLLRPLKAGQPHAGKLLQALVGQVLLRRTKDSKDAAGKSLVSLPSIEYFQVPVQLDKETRSLYDELHEVSKKRFQEALRTGQVHAFLD